jgi:predicted AAA+ superfamily ATPase
MAASNRDRVGRMFELMAPALDRFITAAVAPQLKPGADWTTLVRLYDEQKDIRGKDYAALDPQLQLRMLTENITGRLKADWYPFRDALGRVGQNYCSELRDARNTWAHNGAFTEGDTLRHLDTGQRLLELVGTPDVAEEVEQIRAAVLRLAAERSDRKVLASVVVETGSAGLRPWREVLAPHDDVATGNFKAAEFAADLYKVSATADADRDYADPVTFFSRTYLTEGLRDLITRAVRRLTGDENASPVVNLQTNFGGGKTHSMLALWHLAAAVDRVRYPQELQEQLDGLPYVELAGVHRVALVGNHLAVTGSEKPDGTHVNTIWGELAWQLGGREAYEIVAESDARSTPPGQKLHELLSAYAPAVILIDEWVAYARTLVGRSDLPAGTFDDQFTFAQLLTEAVTATPGVLLAISIPASESGDEGGIVLGNAEEVGGENGLEALRRLQNVVRRVADQWRPASSSEAFHIVRQRLFKAPDGEALAAINQTARGFVELYHKYPDEFPREARDGSYEDRIKATYPIHPELFERLYQDWSGLERFQRTRGVLRLMNTVIHELWEAGDQSALIMPGSIPIAASEVNSELTQYLQDAWKAVIDADVDGESSEPVRIDRERPLFGQRSITRRLARTVFFGAAPTIDSAQKGLEVQRVFLGTAVPGDQPGNFHSALATLGDRATYFYNASGKYWYDLQANITRRAKDQAERVHIQEVYKEIIQRLGGQAKSPGGFARVHVCPDDSADIPDLDEARLVVLHPRLTYQRRTPAQSEAMRFAHAAAERRGTANRTYRNMVVFLAADHERMAELEHAVREYLGWKGVLADADALDLRGSQRLQASERMGKASETVDSRLALTYQWVLVPDGQPIEIKAVKVEGNASSLGERVSRRLGSDGTLAVEHAPTLIRHQLDTSAAKLWEPGFLSAGDLWHLYAEYPYMPRLRDRTVLDAGLTGPQLLWEQEGFALAEGYDETTKRFRGLVLPTDRVTVNVTDATLIVQPDRAEAQREADTAAAAAAVSSAAGAGAGAIAAPGGPGGASSTTATPDSAEAAHDAQPKVLAKTRYFGSKLLRADHPASDFNKVFDEILGPLGTTPNVNLKITIEIEAATSQGFDEAKVRTVSENAATLKFEQSGFEDA